MSVIIIIITGVTLARGIGDKTVNLSVTCNKEDAHLNWNSGGLAVSSIRLAQQCIAQDKRNGSTLPSEVQYSTVLTCRGKSRGCIKGDLYVKEKLRSHPQTRTLCQVEVYHTTVLLGLMDRDMVLLIISSTQVHVLHTIIIIGRRCLSTQSIPSHFPDLPCKDYATMLHVWRDKQFLHFDSSIRKMIFLVG